MTEVCLLSGSSLGGPRNSSSNLFKIFSFFLCFLVEGSLRLLGLEHAQEGIIVQNYSLIGGVNSTNVSGTSGLGWAP